MIIQFIHSLLATKRTLLLMIKVKVYGSDFEDLHKEVHQDILPPEYGGNGMSIAELTGKLILFVRFSSSMCVLHS